MLKGENIWTHTHKCATLVHFDIHKHTCGHVLLNVNTLTDMHKDHTWTDRSICAPTQICTRRQPDAHTSSHGVHQKLWNFDMHKHLVQSPLLHFQSQNSSVEACNTFAQTLHATLDSALTPGRACDVYAWPHACCACLCNASMPNVLDHLGSE